MRRYRDANRAAIRKRALAAYHVKVKAKPSAAQTAILDRLRAEGTIVLGGKHRTPIERLEAAGVVVVGREVVKRGSRRRDWIQRFTLSLPTEL